MELVDCTQEFWEFVRTLRNDSNNQTGFFTNVDITKDYQINFMSENCQNYKICLLDGIPVGYVGIINGNEITFCVDHQHKGKSIGTFMVEEFSKKYTTMVSYVKPENIPSLRVFRKLGWEEKVFFQKKN